MQLAISSLRGVILKGPTDCGLACRNRPQRRDLLDGRSGHYILIHDLQGNSLVDGGERAMESGEFHAYRVRKNVRRGYIGHIGRRGLIEHIGRICEENGVAECLLISHRGAACAERKLTTPCCRKVEVLRTRSRKCRRDGRRTDERD